MRILILVHHHAGGLSCVPFEGEPIGGELRVHLDIPDVANLEVIYEIPQR